VAEFSIASSGAFTPISNTILSTLPDGANNLDMAISGDGKYLFNLQSGGGVIGVYTINPDGTLNLVTRRDDSPSRWRLPDPVQGKLRARHLGCPCAQRW
jgi:6-phosphogluconolactonase